ncbi:anti-sigma factor [Bauldia sp.]|uniref:anti-sigma factor n=1 Tax=Bauldia sp. TaxID=2575872 RepID=UPI003BAD8280
MTERFTDEQLMAYVDGEADADTAAAITTAIDTDRDLAARVAVFAETRRRARDAANVAAGGVPDALRDSVAAMIAEHEQATDPGDETTMVPFRTPPAQVNESRRATWFPALAASIALVVGAVAGYAIAIVDNDSDGLITAKLDTPGIAAALGSLPSGSDATLPETGARLHAIASYRDMDGALCREFEVDEVDRTTVVAVACRQADAWAVQFMVAAPASSDDGYAPASSLEALDAYLTAVGAMAPLEEAEEAAALGAIGPN